MEENKTLENKVLYDGYLTIEERGGREVIQSANAVAAVIYDTVKEKYIFVEQTRPSVEGKTVEVCAGKIDEGENPEEALKREIIEETGYKVDEISHIYDYYSAIGYSTEIISLFYVEVSEKIGEGGGTDEHEDITVVEVDDLGFGGNLIFKGENGEMVPPYRLIDAKSIMAVNYVEHNRIMKDTVEVLTDAKFKTF
jgi:ADP-ribose pyrophosphatase